ncbi:LytR C-terminal domain-containing protein [Leucobacter luti]|uniref:LytR cell envelope-related transcriptional attenuator n=1 Tax=Leucobacter luti TaxID=340320 RepID=A0A4R6S715_9MICO|nr:LytR C-terminal domain-containing protein [Leucobacter luti]QYM75310.1 LytR C-terminal domain-containing protein [Leucobacter luti]TDP95590.1 LytR cell envelope-related transcriptional attenuator [Leucobacter luti]
MAKRTEDAGVRRGTRQDYPEDRFDRVERTGRVGAHRVTARPRYTWQYIIAALLGFAVLTTLGVLTVHTIGDSGKLPISGTSPSSTAEQSAPEAKLDPDATVAILNGTTTENLAAALDQIISTEKWGSILFSGSAAESNVEISAVFYSDPADAPAAAGLAAKLGGLSTYTTSDYDSYNAKLVVLLGADYQGPGLAEAAEMTATAAATPGGEISMGNETVPEGTPEIDPATGWEIDPATGFPIDPATGLATDPAAATS